MYDAVMKSAIDSDIIVKAAAVADYRPKRFASNKIKKKDSDMSIELERTDDIIASLGQNKKKTLFLCGFSMETENMLENAKNKLENKNLDMIVANNVKSRRGRIWNRYECGNDYHKRYVRGIAIMSKKSSG